MNNEFYIECGKLFIGGAPIDLPYAVADVLACGSFCVVRVAPPIGIIFNRNIFAVAKGGAIVWQIAESPHGTQTDKPYMSIACDNEGRLIAGNWIGADYSVSLDTGEVSAVAFDR